VPDRSGSDPALPPRAVRRALAPLLVDPAATAVLSDFDGTLSPIVDDPDDARPLPGAAPLLARLADRFGTVAVVSGRPVSFLLDHLSSTEGAAGTGHRTGGGAVPHFVGLYGLEHSTPDGRVVPDPVAAEWRPVVDATVARLRAAAPEGAFVEPKGLAVTVHWRTVPGAAWASGAVRDEEERTGLQVHPGRRNLELRPPSAIDKGSVVARLLEGRRAACYFGDDLGDLPAFAALAHAARRGMATVAVAVADEESPAEVLEAADLIVQGPDEAFAALYWLAESPPVG